MNMSVADAFIAAWDAKYHYGYWRPITAIQLADTDGNPDTVEDLTWEPLIVTPPYPDYVERAHRERRRSEPQPLAAPGRWSGGPVHHVDGGRRHAART